MINAQEKTEIGQKFLTALSTQDWDLMKSILSAGIVWSLPGNSLISGEAIGMEAVIKRAKLIVTYEITFTLKHILCGRYGVAISLNNTARRGDLILDEHIATVCQVRDGKIFAIDTYVSDIAMLNDFFV